MAPQDSNQSATCIGRYPIASGDMYYSEVEQRDIYVVDEPEKGIRIWGEIPMGGPVTAVELCQVFLEYALSCASSQDAEQAYHAMGAFGMGLGERLAEYIKSTPLIKDTTDPGACALECLLESIHAHLSIEHVGPELRFIIADCPILEVSHRTGLRNVELAQYGFNIMCQRLITEVEPTLLLRMPTPGESSQTFTLVNSTHAQLQQLAIAHPLPAREEQVKKEVTVDAYSPPEMATRAMETGVKKVALDTFSTFTLAILAGAFIAMGAVFATTVSAGGSALPYGVVRLLAGLAFSLGLIMVVVAGSELFTGNNLIVMAFLNRNIRIGGLVRNWTLVYIGNFVGAIATAFIVFLTRQYTFGNGAVGLTMLNIGETKTSLDFVQAIALGICCNALVCMAVWMCFSAHTTVDKILAIIPPIAAFVAAGFEHSIANMYFIPIALFVKYNGSPSFFTAIQKTPADFPHLTWQNFFVANLLPVTIGNIIGGALMVGIVYWFVYTSGGRKLHSLKVSRAHI
jgi:formate transporter